MSGSTYVASKLLALLLVGTITPLRPQDFKNYNCPQGKYKASDLLRSGS